MDNVPATKVCTKCKVEKPAAEFYVKDKKTGRRFARCKACMNAVSKERYQADGEEARRKSREAASRQRALDPEGSRRKKREWRQANLERVREQERGREAKPERLAKRKAHREANRERRIAYNRRYKEERAGQVSASNAEYRERNRQALRQRSREWRELNPERDYEIHAGWKRRNPDKVKAAQHRRRLKALAGGTYTPEEWQAVKARHGHRCVMCGRHESEVKLCVDHVIALDRGGRNTADNLQPLCRSCNSKKHTRPWDFRWRRGNAWPRFRAVTKRY